MDTSKSWQQCQAEPAWPTGFTHGEGNGAERMLVTESYREGLIPISWSLGQQDIGDIGDFSPPQGNV